jgi:hypothetical protein
MGPTFLMKCVDQVIESLQGSWKEIGSPSAKVEISAWKAVHQSGRLLPTQPLSCLTVLHHLTGGRDQFAVNCEYVVVAFGPADHSIGLNTGRRSLQA